MVVTIKICVVDDEEAIRLVLTRFLIASGYQPLECKDGVEALETVERENPALLLMDVDMPRLNGWETLRQLRHRGYRVPVIMLTRVDDIPARIRGLEAGADDYIGKPCDLMELLARIRALLRRAPESSVTLPLLKLGPNVIDLERKSARQAEAELHLTRKEFALLTLLARYHGKPVSREQLSREVWGAKETSNSHTLDTHLWRLKKKLGDKESQWIRSMPGIGFVLEGEIELATPPESA